MSKSVWIPLKTAKAINTNSRDRLEAISANIFLRTGGIVGLCETAFVGRVTLSLRIEADVDAYPLEGLLSAFQRFVSFEWSMLKSSCGPALRSPDSTHLRRRKMQA